MLCVCVVLMHSGVAGQAWLHTKRPIWIVWSTWPRWLALLAVSLADIFFCFELKLGNVCRHVSVPSCEGACMRVRVHAFVRAFVRACVNRWYGQAG